MMVNHTSERHRAEPVFTPRAETKINVFAAIREPFIEPTQRLPE
jgi:hypothetical protein